MGEGVGVGVFEVVGGVAGEEAEGEAGERSDEKAVGGVAHVDYQLLKPECEEGGEGGDFLVETA